ncbi:MAG TPA: PPC domain-containing protein [Humisphaera sp.]
MSRPALLLRASLGLTAVAACAFPASAQEKKDDKKDAPRVTAVVPLAVSPGGTAKLKIRGMKLDKAKGVRLVEPSDAKDGLKVELKKAATADGGKDDKTKGFGDSLLDVELTLPKDLRAGEVKLVVTTPDGDAAAVPVVVLPKDLLVDEKEPNGGFKSAQPVKAPCVVRGAIGEEKDVDVYRVAGKAGQTLKARVRAAGLASVLDASVAIYDAKGRLLASADDAGAGDRDPVLTLKLPADGDYLVSVIDANDRGSATTHPYLLELTVE